MIRFQIQMEYATIPGMWMNGTRYIVRGEEVGASPVGTYEEAHRTVKRQMARDRKYRPGMCSYRIQQITYTTVGEFKP